MDKIYKFNNNNNNNIKTTINKTFKVFITVNLKISSNKMVGINNNFKEINHNKWDIRIINNLIIKDNIISKVFKTNREIKYTNKIISKDKCIKINNLFINKVKITSKDSYIIKINKVP
jgi:hypothetical protein